MRCQESFFRRDNMAFGSRLKEVRKEKGFSQNQVAEELYVSRQSVSKWENGFCYPELENFYRLCKLYDKTSEELLKGINVYGMEIQDVNDSGVNDPEVNDPEVNDPEVNDPEVNDPENVEIIVISEEKYDLNSFSFLSFVPFVGLYYVVRKYLKDIGKAKTKLFLLNFIISVFITLGFIMFVYYEIPKTSRMNSSYLSLFYL